MRWSGVVPRETVCRRPRALRPTRAMASSSSTVPASTLPPSFAGSQPAGELARLQTRSARIPPGMIRKILRMTDGATLS